VVFAIFGLSELVDKQLYRARGWAHKTQTSQMSHLLARGVIEAVNKVDFMIEEGGLGDGGRDNWNL
jgi:hypothetical protein